MPTFIFYKCNKCKKALETLQPYFSTGIPFLLCESCNTVTIIHSDRTEWDLKTPYQRFSARFDTCGIGVFIGGSIGFFLALLLQKILHFDSNILLIILFVAGSFIGIRISSRSLQETIRESRERMSNKNYVELLERLGLDEQHSKK